MVPASTQTGGPRSSPPSLQYQKLKLPLSIRLLSVQTRREDGEICCQLHDAIADPSDPEFLAYHCLSYTWGNPLGDDDRHSPSGAPTTSIWDQRKRIRVRGPGSDEPGSLMVTRNLYNFLEELERCCGDNHQVQYLWIDAICINQGDLDERATQVALMNRIYSNCTAVIVWFGIEDADATTAFPLLAALDVPHDVYNACVTKASLGGGPGVDMEVLYGELGIVPVSPEVILSAASFLQRAWLYRVWTLQESKLPKVGYLWCGRLRSSLQALSNFIRLIKSAINTQHHPILRDLPKDQIVPQRLYESFNRIPWNRQVFLNAIGTVSDVRHGKCSDARDMIYGVFGLLKAPAPIRVDYTKSVEDVYIDWATACGPSESFGELEDPLTRVTEGLPSWVPDYQVPQWPFDWTRRGGNVYKAGRPQDGKVQQVESGDRRILTLTGLEEDIVSVIGASHQETIHGDGLMRSLDILLAALQGGSLALPSTPDHDLVEDFWRTLIANLPGNNNRHPQSEEFGPWFRSLAQYLFALWICDCEDSHSNGLVGRVEAARLLVARVEDLTRSGFFPRWDEILQLHRALHHLGRDGTEDDRTIVDEVVHNMLQYLESLDLMFSNRRFFITAKGRLAVGPQVVATGDTIFVIPGFPFPFVFRKASDFSKTGRYRVLGQVYVQGIMNGEALENGRDLRRVDLE